jgi:quercetin dioxygenase-like cupin family protein
VPYVVRYGEGRRHLVAGQIIYTIAATDETSGGFGAMLTECPLDRMPIPLHYHDREHDTWFCVRGRLQVWCEDQSRVLTPGDFAYVRPGDVHSYQSVAPRTSFFGVVAPGGWEAFFGEAGEVWGMTALPPADRPFDFARMGPAMAKFGINRVADGTYAPATAIGDSDRALPGAHRSYFLDAGYGRRHALRRHLSTALMTADETNGTFDMRLIEGGDGATMPTLHHAKTTVFIFVVAGAVAVTIDGREHVLTGGDGANIPPGTRYATRVANGIARWVLTTAGGNGGELWEAGHATDLYCHASEGPGSDADETVAPGPDIDVTLG